MKLRFYSESTTYEDGTPNSVGEYELQFFNEDTKEWERVPKIFRDKKGQEHDCTY